MIVYPPDEDGGRRVGVDGEFPGRAYGLRAIAEFLRQAGIEDIDETYAAAVGPDRVARWRPGHVGALTRPTNH
ncbi:hypothetical protein [Streptomyces sp. NPDC002156]